LQSIRDQNREEKNRVKPENSEEEDFGKNDSFIGTKIKESFVSYFMNLKKKNNVNPIV
jgi:hypothetical protein